MTNPKIKQFEHIQQLLDENEELIKVILKFQNEGKMMDAILYQARLQINLTQLAAIADNHVHPSVKISDTKKVDPRLVQFVDYVQTNGLEDVENAALSLNLPVSTVISLGVSYYKYLIQNRRETEAEQLKQDLSSKVDLSKS